MQGHWDVNPKEFIEVVKEWHRQALSNITTKDFLETWLDFLKAWERIEYKNIDPTYLYEVCINCDPPKELAADHPEYPELIRLGILCRELQKAHNEFGTTPYLSCRTIGKILGVSHETGNKYFNILAGEQYIKIMQKGFMAETGGVATRFEYIAA